MPIGTDAKDFSRFFFFRKPRDEHQENLLVGQPLTDIHRDQCCRYENNNMKIVGRKKKEGEEKLKQ